MRRVPITPRSFWQDKVSDAGLIWHMDGDEPYWREDAYYSFELAEIEQIEQATASMYELMLKAGDHILARQNDSLLHMMGIPEVAHRAIRKAWENEPPCLNYGRFDFGYDGTNLKMFEFNCDTPTSLLEASVIQWQWKEEVFPHLDQYNSIHEHLVEKWQDIAPYLRGRRLHFAHNVDASGEEVVTVGYLRDTAAEAGLESKLVLIDDIGIDSYGRFLDMDDRIIDTVFKLYPWEWLVREEYAGNIMTALDNGSIWMEPIWKMIWSNKAILPIMTTLDPYNEFLLPADFYPPAHAHVKKPFLSREGANISIVQPGGPTIASDGDYGEEGYIYQHLFHLPEMAPGAYPVLGCWIVDGSPCGMGIREDGLITRNTAKFLPHVIEG